MMGKHHVMVNTGILGAGLVSLAAAYYSLTPINPRPFVFSVFSVWKGLYFLLLYAVFVIGSLFPDIDSHKSALGRYIYLPVSHRTWTHSFISVLLLFPLLFAGFIGIFFFLGYVLHLLADSVSAGGICWFYPLVRFREYSSGAKVAPGHRIKLYHTGKLSEKWFVFFILLMVCFISFVTGVWGHGFYALYVFLRNILFSG